MTVRNQKQGWARRAWLPVLALCMALAVVWSAYGLQAEAADASAYAAVFDAGYYADHYPDVKAAYGTDANALLQHFLTCGVVEGRQGCEEFNVYAYRARYADLAAAFGDELVRYYAHYLTTGKAEGRNGRVGADQGQASTQQTQTLQRQSTQDTTQTTTQASDQSDFRDQVVAIVNQERTQRGLPALSVDSRLAAAAQARAEEQVERFSHTRPDGSSCFSILPDYGVTYHSAAENIAAGQRSPEAVMYSWMNSEGHRNNILNAGLGHIGVGFVKSQSGWGYYWVQMFTD